ncbi:MAG: SH3 domain-containing C40 family peptidase [Sedimentisphaerales bacterium]
MINRLECLIVLINIFLPAGLAGSKDAESPQPDIGNEKFGIISVPVANLKESPSHKAELADQEIMGYVVKVLKRKDNPPLKGEASPPIKSEASWYQVETEYGYVGWVTDKSFCGVDEAAKKQWETSDKIIVTKIFGIIYSRQDETSVPVANVVLNVLLRRIEQKGGPASPAKRGEWTKVCTPDGRTGYLRSENAVEAPIKRLSGERLRSALVKTAKSMTGIPYLWGGKSSTACDCSGFTQTVFRANGINLLRDAKQQALEGEAVDYDATFSNVAAGDLLFFGSDRITHTGMSLGGAEFIHQSGDVHINSLEPNAPNYSPSHRKNLKAIRRICK